MRIAQVAPPFETVPPERYGGTERVVSALTEELVRRGHEVTLIAPAGSRTAARLLPSVDKALWLQDPEPTDLSAGWLLTLGQLWNHVDEFDIIHSHLDRYGFAAARAAPVPMLTTLHNRLDVPEMRQVFEHFEDIPLAAISDSQRRQVQGVNWVGVVHHGIHLEEFTFSPRHSEYLAFLGRISPDKGLDAAIRVARRAGLPLRVAAREPLSSTFDPNANGDVVYFEEVIRPLLADGGVELIGQVDATGRDELLRNAAALLFPIRWPEPFGLVMIESLACGTPVVALECGSVPEVIRTGVTGFVCRSEDELVNGVERIDDIDRRACRQEAESRFSPGSMAANYEAIYRRLLNDQAPGAPLQSGAVSSL
ncbi:MAG: glycosyltransferase family 4 protein [Chloroflexi bacterium]|nr:glycosyltransferase family 4 protein [Chloroflexota bacterium]